MSDFLKTNKNNNIFDLAQARERERERERDRNGVSSTIKHSNLSKEKTTFCGK